MQATGCCHYSQSCLTFSDPSSVSAWHSRARKDLGSLQSVVFVVRKTVPPTLSLTHWLRGVSSWPGPPCCPAPAISLLSGHGRVRTCRGVRSTGYRTARCRYSHFHSGWHCSVRLTVTDQSQVTSETVLSRVYKLFSSSSSPSSELPSLL